MLRFVTLVLLISLSLAVFPQKVKRNLGPGQMKKTARSLAAPGNTAMFSTSTDAAAKVGDIMTFNLNEDAENNGGTTGWIFLERLLGQ
jgi:flagellar basal body L-ring protein FlgH